MTTRIFNIGAIKGVKDPAPNQTLATSIELLSHSYPSLRSTKVYDSDGVMQEDGSILFDVTMPVNKVNG